MATRMVDTDLNFSGVGKIIRALMNPVASDPGTPGAGEVWYNTTDNRLKVYTGSAVRPLAFLDDVTGGAITGTLWDAQSVITAVADNTPQATIMGASTVLGRRSTGNIGAVSYANLLADLEALGVTASDLQGSNLASVLSRGNHTGTQLSSTISDFNTAADARAQAIVDAVVAAAPGTLDTLNELAAALGDDPNFATTITNSIATKTGKYAANIGNASLQTFTVNHALATTDVTVSVRVNATGAMVDCGVVVQDANNVVITTNSVPASNAYRVVVIG